MRTKFAFYSALFLLFVGQVVFAQVTGKVMDGDGFPVSDAEVTVRGKSATAMTDENGAFSIDASINDVIVITDVMGTVKDFKVTRLNMGTLKFSESIELTTVTLVGGIKMDNAQKVGSYDVVTKEDFELTPYSSVDDVLNGRVAGLTFSAASGDPGSSNMVIIRGVSSLEGSPNPLYVIDGVVVGKGADNAAIMESWNPLASLDPNAIEKVEVLKDASATALYGARGANGVILITTKAGKYNQKTRYSFSSEMAVQDRAFDKMKLMNGDEYIKYGAMLMWNSQGGNGLPTNVTFNNLQEAQDYYLANFESQWTPGTPYTDWTDAVTRDLGVINTYSFSATGGGENTSFRIGGSYYVNKPWIYTAYFDRISLNSALNHKASEKLNFGLNLNYSNVKRSTYAGGRASANPVNSAIMLSPLRPIYAEDGSYNQDLGLDMTSGFNPVGVLEGSKELSRINTLIGSVNMDYQFVKNIYFNSLFGAQYQFMKETRLIDSYIPMFTLSIDGYGFYQQEKTDILDWNWSNSFSYRNIFNDKHDVAFYLGMEYQDHYYKNLGAYTFHMTQFKPYLMYADTENGEIFASNIDYYWKQISYFSRLNYTFDNKYVVSGQFRRDGNSTLGAKNKFGNFWSLGAAWNLHNEEFIPDTFSNFVLRASYGVLGNIPYADQWGAQYNSQALIGINGGASWGGNPGIIGISFPGNDNLAWEEAKHLDIGMELGFFNNRLRIGMDYYNKITDLAIFDTFAAPETGMSAPIKGNAATLDNKGFELTIDATVFNTDNFKWFINANGSYQKTMVDKLYQDLVQFGSDDPGDSDNALVALSPGHILGEYYVIEWGGIDENGDAWYWTDETRTERTTDRTLANPIWQGKNAFPQYMASITNEFRYKNVSLSVMFAGQFEYMVQNGVNSYTIHDGRFPNRNQIVEALYDSWTDAPGMENFNASNPRALLGNPSISRLESSRFMYKGDHIRLKELKLAYAFGDLFKTSTGIDNLSVYFRGTNLWTYAFDDRLKFDPESNSNSWSWVGKGRYWYASPVLRTFSIGIQIDF